MALFGITFLGVLLLLASFPHSANSSPGDPGAIEPDIMIQEVYPVLMTAVSEDNPIIHVHVAPSSDANCSIIPPEHGNACLILMSAGTETILDVTLASDEYCNRFGFKNIINGSSIGYFYAKEPLCPTRTRCPFKLTWVKNGGVYVSRIFITVIPNQALTCPKALRVTENGIYLRCNASQHEENFCYRELPYALDYNIVGADSDALILTRPESDDGVWIYARPDQRYSVYNASVDVHRVVQMWGRLMNTSISVLSAKEQTETLMTPSVEIRGGFAGIGESFTMACAHGYGKKEVGGFSWEFASNKKFTTLSHFNGTQIITLRNMSLADKGRYRCSFEDHHGEVNTSQPVTISVNEVEILRINESFPIIPERRRDKKYLNYALKNSDSTKNAAVQFLKAILRERSMSLPLTIKKLHMRSLTWVKDGSGVASFLMHFQHDYSLETITRQQVLFYPEAFFNARKFLSGEVIGSPRSEDPLIEGESTWIAFQFASCVEHRTHLSFVWKFNGLIIDYSRLESSFHVTQEVEKEEKQFLCTMELRIVKLIIQEFKEEYLGRYDCEMRIAYANRLLPWIVIPDSQNITEYHWHRLPRATIYPPKVYISKGQNVTFSCSIRYAHQAEFIVTETESLHVRKESINVTDFHTPQEATITVFAETTSTVSCNVSNSVKTIQSEATLKVTKVCDQDTDDWNIVWSSFKIGELLEKPCPSDYIGNASRFCNDQGIWEKTSYSNCFRKDLMEIKNEIDNMKGKSQLSSNDTDSISTKLLNVMTTSSPKRPKDVSIVLDSMMNTLSRTEDDKMSNEVLIGTKSLENFVNITDILLSTDENVWNDLQEADDEEGIVTPETKLLTAMDSFADSSLKEKITDETLIVRKNLVMKRKRLEERSDIKFPNSNDISSLSKQEIRSSAFLPSSAFGEGSAMEGIQYALIVYTNVEKLFDKPVKTETKDDNKSEIVSEILSFSMNVDISMLKSGLQLQFEPARKNYPNLECVYLDTSNPTNPVWSSRHCKTVVTDKGMINCTCTHLTNFAVLMNPRKVEPDHRRALGVITKLGCSLSICCLVTTLVIYFAVWNHVKGDRSVLHVILSGFLTMVYLTFLSGIEKTQNKASCLATTIFLHYFLLVVFSIMLTEGIEVYLRIRLVFSRKSWGWKLIAPPLIIPGIIVVVTIGSTWERGYRSDHFCWLGTTSGAIWSILVPAILVIVVNFVITVLVLRIMLSTHTLMKQDTTEKTKTVLKAICVITPLLGFTWLFGFFSIIKDAIVFQYLFAILNTLQGVFIFVFHCLLSKQIREALKIKKHVFQSRYMSSSRHSTVQSRLRSTTESNHNNMEMKTDTQHDGSTM